MCDDSWRRRIPSAITMHERYAIVLRASLTTKNQEPSRVRRLLGSGGPSSITMVEIPSSITMVEIPSSITMHEGAWLWSWRSSLGRRA